MKFKEGQTVTFQGFQPGGSRIRTKVHRPGDQFTVKKYGQSKGGVKFLQVEEDPNWFYDENIFK